MSNKDVTCKDVMSHICDNLGEDLDSPRCVEIKEHLANCDSCKKYMKSVETTIDFYKNYNVDLGEAGHDRLLSFLGIKED